MILYCLIPILLHDLFCVSSQKIQNSVLALDSDFNRTLKLGQVKKHDIIGLQRALYIFSGEVGTSMLKGQLREMVFCLNPSHIF